MKTLSDHIQWGTQFLRSKGIEDSTLSSQLLFSKASGLSKEEIIRSPERMVDESVSNEFKKMIEERSKDIPISHLTREKEFYSMKFNVDSNVLIPRPETELLVDLFKKKIGNKSLKVCDVGTGSGIIAITLKKQFPKLEVFGIDISPKALHIAKLNARFHKVNVDWVESDLFDRMPDIFDVMVANLPYIPTVEIATLPRSVQHEPQLALDGGEDGLKVYEKLLDQVDQHLIPTGEIFFEFGERQSKKLSKMLKEKKFSSIEVIKDLAGIERVVYAQRNGK